jgi:membrane protease YdiL (CAAX protease family)
MSIWSRLLGFFVCAYGFTWACWLTIVAASLGWVRLPVSKELLATVGQFGPFVAAVLLTAIESGGPGLRDLLHRMLRWRVGLLWYGVALLLPPASLLCAIGIRALAQGQSLVMPQGVSPEVVIHLLINLLIGGALGEEPGWRGYALPRLLAKSSGMTASILLALAWAGWHLPLWWIADVPCSFPFYVIGIIPLTILFTWLHRNTNESVLIAMLFHASLNTALVRLPVRPAFETWTALLWVMAVLVVIVKPWSWLGPKRGSETVTQAPVSPVLEG